MATDPSLNSGPTYCQSYNDPRCPIRVRVRRQVARKKEDCRIRVCARQKSVWATATRLCPSANPFWPQAPTPPAPRAATTYTPSRDLIQKRTSCRKGLTPGEHSELARGLLGRAGAPGGIPDGPVYRREQACLVPGGQLSYISTNVVQRTARWQKQRHI